MTTRTTRPLIAALLASCAAVACSSNAPTSGTSEPEGNVGESASPIINGTTSTTAQDSVVMLVMYQGNQPFGTCTGTLVAQNLVLTAHHCVSHTDEEVVCATDGSAIQGGTVQSDIDPTQIYVYTGVNAYQHAGSKQQAAARGQQAVVDNKNLLCNDDLAFLILNTSITNMPIATMRLSGPARENEQLTSVGWGLTESGDIPSQRQQRTGVKVEAVGPQDLDPSSGIGLGDAEFLVPESICSGDSGGPAFSSKGAVVGVVSRGGGGGQSQSNPAANCVGNQVFNFYTQLVTKGAFVTKAFGLANAQPRDEGGAPGAANGEKCQHNLDCSSNGCVSGVCMARCDNGASCPSGQKCKPDGDIMYCDGTASTSTPSSSDPSTSTEDPSASDDTASSEETAAPVTTTTTTSGCSVTSPGTPAGTPTTARLAGLALVAASARRRRR